jgi:hypothetical protein
MDLRLRRSDDRGDVDSCSATFRKGSAPEPASGECKAKRLTGSRSRLPLVLVALLLTLFCTAVSAAPRAWLDRNRIALGETVTLNIATTGMQAPDFASLQEFSPRGHTSQRRFELVNGQATMRSLYTVVLRPQRAGRVTIPPVRVGRETTSPLTLDVSATAPQTPARAGDDVFIESIPDDLDPYVQQAVGWVVRLYSAVPLVSGHLDQHTPDGAALQRIGDDAQYTREIGGRRYTVVERRYLLVPERSGELAVPAATFEGRGVGGFFDSLFGSIQGGSRGGTLQARGPTRVLQVRPVPAGAPQPWLPLHALKLRYATTPDRLQAGRAATLAIELVADGATAAQLPDLELPPIDGVQVFAEPPQSDERFVDGRPRVTLTRRFSLVPAQAGPVRLPGLRVPWWDVGGGQRRVAELASLEWEVQPGAANAPAAGRSDSAGQSTGVSRSAGNTAADATTGGARRWIIVAMVFAALWLATLVWALQRRNARELRAEAAAPRRVATDERTGGRPRNTDLRRLLDTGAPDEIVAALQAMAEPPARSVDELAACLDDAAQRAALDTLQRARWGGGDLTAARRAMRAAFANGPRWRRGEAAASEVLPPLYPDRRRWSP